MRIRYIALLFSYLALNVTCQNSQEISTKHPDFFKVIKVENIVINKGETDKLYQVDNKSLLSKLMILNLSDNLVQVNYYQDHLVPTNIQISKSADNLVELNNYSLFHDADSKSLLNWNSKDTLEVYIGYPAIRSYDSIRVKTEIIFQNRRYQLDYTLYEDFSCFGYFIKDSSSKAQLMIDTITNYSNRNIKSY